MYNNNRVVIAATRPAPERLHSRVAESRAPPAGCYLPVLPSPPSARSLAAEPTTTRQRAWITGTMTG